jgi:adenylate cyclase, class 2
MAREIEAKFPLDNRPAIISRLEGAGAEQLYPETFEDNMILDRRGELRTKGALLRVRRFGRYTLVTFKGTAGYSGGVKTRDEVQTGIESFDRAISLFDSLGYRPTFRYQKLREVWRLGDAEVVLDRTPIGNYLEIEGPMERIESVAAILGLDMDDAIRASYADLYRKQRRTRPDLPENMVFSPEELPGG